MQAGNLSEIMFFKTHCLVPKKGQTVQHLCWGDTELVNHCHFYYTQAEYHRTSKAKHLLSEKNDLRSRAFFSLYSIWNFMHLAIWNVLLI